MLADGTIEGFVGGDCAESTVRAQALAVLDSGESRRAADQPDAGGPGARQADGPQPVPQRRDAGDLPRAAAARRRWSPSSATARSPGPSSRSARRSATRSCRGRRRPRRRRRGRRRVARPRRGRRRSSPRCEAGVGVRRARRQPEARRRGRRRARRRRRRCAARDRHPGRARHRRPHAEEVALSILADIVARRPAARPARPGRPRRSAPPRADDRPTDPVCGMAVAAVDVVAAPRPRRPAATTSAAPGCLRAFAADPDRYPSP